MYIVLTLTRTLFDEANRRHAALLLYSRSSGHEPRFVRSISAVGISRRIGSGAACTVLFCTCLEDAASDSILHD